MAADIERLAREIRGYPEVAALLMADAAVARKLGVPEQLTGLDLGRKWEKQAERLAYLFASELRQSREQYMDGLPRFTPQPESYRGRFDTLTLVQTPTSCLTLARILDIAGIVNDLDLEDVKDWQEDLGKFKAPSTSYLTWLHDGSGNLNRSVQSVRANLASDERGGTILDGVALFIQNPDILKDHYLDLPGSRYGSDDAPSLYFWFGQPMLDYYFVDNAYPEWGSVVAGREIVTK